MSDIHITLSRNTIVDRLRVLACDLTRENRHTDAMLIDMTIQALRVDAGEAERRVIETVRSALTSGLLDDAAWKAMTRLSQMRPIPK